MAEHSFAAKTERSRNRNWLQRKAPLRVSTPDDLYEREADRAAAAVMSGRCLTRAGLSLSRIPVTHMQRDDGQSKSDADKYKAAAQRLGEAFLETEVGKKLKAHAMRDPLVKSVKEAGESFIGTLPGKAITGADAMGAVATLAVTHKALPAQIPDIPLDKITPGLEAKIIYEGSVDNPTKAMITFSYTEQGAPEKKSAKRRAESQREENARMARELARFRAGLRYAPGTPEARQQRAEEEAFTRAAFAGVGRLPGSVDLPGPFPAPGTRSSARQLQWPISDYGYGPKPFSLLDEALKLKPIQAVTIGAEPEEKKEETPVQRKASGAIPSVVNEVVNVGGQPLDTETRADMEARFGCNFADVRVHTSAQAAASARAIEALAYTVGNDIVFAPEYYSPRTAMGRQLLTHELAHVVQQSAAPSSSALIVQRAGALESVGRFFRDVFFFIPSLFGLEISYGNDELLEYLADITKADKIQGGYYSDDKARQIVARWKEGHPRFKLEVQQMRLLILEMEDGNVTDGDRQGILDLLADGAAKNVTLNQLFMTRGIKLNELRQDLKEEPYRTRFTKLFIPWFAKQRFGAGDRPLAGRILRDLLAVIEDKLDFANLDELRTEVFKRMRTSQLMRESQNDLSFDYPENMKAGDCPDYDPTNQMKNARVNLAARAYWSDVILDSKLVYYFKLTPFGREHGYEALTKLFTPQGPGRQDPNGPDPNICKKTLIHCDYLVNVIHYRTYAETVGKAKFDRLVKDGAIVLWLTYTGFPKANVEDWRKSPKALSVQEVRPGSEKDLVIGDHVIFWNHLAYDGLNATFYGPWRLENAILVDMDSAGRDLFQGHGTAERNRDQMREELAEAYNPLATKALNLAKDVDDDIRPMSDLTNRFPNVKREEGKWVVVDPGLYGDNRRKGARYKLRTVTDWINDPDLPGLHDPHDREKMYPVKRPLESAERLPPKL